MSTESRLERLGLLHLIDKPEELSREIKRQIAEDQARQAEGEKRRLEIRKVYLAKQSQK